MYYLIIYHIDTGPTSGGVRFIVHLILKQGRNAFGADFSPNSLILKKKINQSNLIKKVSWACGPAAGPIGPAAAAAAPLRPRRVPAPNAPLLMGTVMCGLDGTMTINASLSFFCVERSETVCLWLWILFLCGRVSPQAARL
jgi:hypothetical protein